MKIKFLTRIVFIFSLVLTYSCERDKVDFAIISGQVLNAKKLKFNARYGSENIDKTIFLNEDGEFLDTIYTKEGLYSIFDGKSMIGFYLRPGKKYGINYDANTFQANGIMLLGNDTLINNYYTKKSQNRVFINPAERTSEPVIRTFLNDIRQSELKLLESSELSAEMKSNERYKIQYQYLVDLILCLYYGEIKSPSEKTLNELKIDYNNEEHYKKFGVYNRLVDLHYSSLLTDYVNHKLATDSLFSRHQEAINFYSSSIPNEYIKNDVIVNSALFHLKNSKDINKFHDDFENNYTGNDTIFINKIADLYTKLTDLKIGSVSPKFFDYKNFKSGTSSLDDFLGKTLYINLWATWCGNCYNEMEDLNNLTKEFDNKDIEFISIAWKDSESKWRKVIEEKELLGVQLLANKKSNQFFKEYGVYGIPRHIMIDKKGKIIDYNALSPTNPKLKEILNNLVN